MPEPKTKVKQRSGKRSQTTQRTQAPPESSKVANQVKRKQMKQRLRQASLADVALRPSVVVLEDLNVEGMKRNRKLALSISDVGMGEFRRQMSYKTVWQGETVLIADRWFPSTKKCSKCGNVKEKMDISERIYDCDLPECDNVLNRDFNAALSLAALAR